MSAKTTRLEIHYDIDHGGEWAALYVDGELVIVGDAYLAEENAFDLLGVKIVQDAAFMRGQDSRKGVAQTLAEVDAYRAERDRRRATAAEMREQAARLVAEADALEKAAAGEEVGK